ncbi:MAG: Cys-tRNA(Pro) deacylase [Pisciglobus halotolerans]|nr:Cys-tRNA(Pro) deacylase [Pisciglobus halotolerans]
MHVKKKKKTPKTNAIRLLENEKVPFNIHTYAWNEKQVGVDKPSESNEKEASTGTIYKTLVTIGDKTGVLVAVIPGSSELDLKALAKVSGNKKVEMLHMKDLFATTGYVRGGCSPIGMKKNFPTYFSERAVGKETITVSAGKRGLQVEVSPEQLKQITHGSFAVIEADE